MITLKSRKIGIWGFGSVGKAALAYLSGHKAQCGIYDKRLLTHDELALAHTYQAHVHSCQKLEQFLQSYEYILASPGVDISLYKEKTQFICELDLFAQEWYKPSIGVTGTIGKTTLTTLLYTILKKKMKVFVGGNIGIPLLDSITQQKNSDIAVLELSSWQLEYAHFFAPDIAILTNLYPNHLDRHKTMDAYFQAKAHLLTHQRESNIAIVPLDLWSQIQELKIRSQCIWVHHIKPTSRFLDAAESLIYLDNDRVIYRHDSLEHELIRIAHLPPCTFITNWLFVAATLVAMKLPTSLIYNTSIQLEHRLEHVGTHGNLTFYNDSKGTTPEATRAAVERFKHDKIILFLGGLSKGVDRTSLIEQLPKNVVSIMCFGAEADLLKKICTKHQRNVYACANLEEAFFYAIKNHHNATVALFSPSGASFDLYANYQERGAHFKQLVTLYTGL